MKLKSLLRLCYLGLVLTVFHSTPVVAAESIVLDGLIEPHLIVKIGSPVAGILKTIEVDRGDMVSEGQVLATLQSEVERATLALARARSAMKSTIRAREARLKYNRRKQQRMEKLFKKKVIPFEEMDEARTNSDMALMELEEAKDNQRLAELELNRSLEVVKRMSIHSPIAGVVMERFLSPGEYVEDQPILKLAQIDPLNVEIFAPVELLRAIRIGMHAEVTPENPGSKVFQAEVKIVDQVVDAASGTFGVRLELPNPKHSLSAGLKCKVSFPIQ